MAADRTDQIGSDSDKRDIIVFDHVTKKFPGTGRKDPSHLAVDDISFTVRKGEIFGIIGYSGAGKSTLIRLINQLERPSQGKVQVFGQEVTALSESKMRPIRQKIGMVFQQFNLFASKTVAGNIEYPLIQDQWRKDYRQARVAELLDFVGLTNLSRKYPSQLSGGQKQRVGIARALATHPDILLADEATSALDPQTTGEVLELLQRANHDFGVTIVLITHQMDVVTRIADRVMVMSQGWAVEEGPLYRVFAHPRQKITRDFVATAINSIPSQEEVAKLRSHLSDREDRLVTVIMRNPDPSLEITPSGQRISSMLTHRGITNTILVGGVQEVAQKSLGAFTYIFHSDDGKLDTYIQQLRLANCIVDFGSLDNPIDYDQALAAYEHNEEDRLQAVRSQNWQLNYDQYVEEKSTNQEGE